MKQAGILQGVPSQSRYLFFSLAFEADCHAVLRDLAGLVDGNGVVLGMGQPLLDALGTRIDGFVPAPSYAGSGIAIPALPFALWLWLRGEDRGELVGLTVSIEEALGDQVILEEVIDGFRFAEGRDLSGYIDGTENPEGEAAESAGFVTEGQLSGSSFVAVQKWLHDLPGFRQLSVTEQDDMIGRRISDNEEMDDAPLSAHVKRAAQESFDPEAFLLRRSMPWADFSGEGLVFVAFGHSFDAFDVIMKRMLGLEDGVVDGLFRFSRCLGTGFYWCPPMVDGKPDFSIFS